MQKGALLGLGLFALGAAGCGAGAREARDARAPARVHDAASVRRVCMQMGLGPDGAGGGSVVFQTGPEKGGIGVTTMRGEHVLAPSPDALCPVAVQQMRVCPAASGRSADVPVLDRWTADAKTIGKLGRGAPLAFYEYVSGGGPTKAIVDVGGKARFIPADEVCHPDGAPPPSRATVAFKMNGSVSAGPKAFRPRSTATIQRIVIHNTEVPLAETLRHFGRPEANTSAHVVVDRDGSIYRVVEDQYAAFHAGASKDGFGGYNSTSLGIEVVAFSDPKYTGNFTDGFFSDAQRRAVIELVSFWLAEYKLEIVAEILQNRSSREGYADLEYRRAAVTIHRLTKADRGTDCPRLLFPSSPEGDEEFFRWREATFGTNALRKAER